jgi:hypothetical protein
MTGGLLKRILQKCCFHQFSWPHTGIHGRDYQVCLICGAAYEFDCATMRRTGRLMAPTELEPEPLSGRQAGVSRTG